MSPIDSILSKVGVDCVKNFVISQRFTDALNALSEPELVLLHKSICDSIRSNFGSADQKIEHCPSGKSFFYLDLSNISYFGGFNRSANNLYLLLNLAVIHREVFRNRNARYFSIISQINGNFGLASAQGKIASGLENNRVFLRVGDATIYDRFSKQEIIISVANMLEILSDGLKRDRSDVENAFQCVFRSTHIRTTFF
jgi:hypothetical protein